jgi:hypothetical protein
MPNGRLLPGTEAGAAGKPQGPAFHACPRLRCYASSRSFGTLAEAEAFAERQAKQSHIGYAIYQVLLGRLKLLKLFDPPPAPC